MRLPSLIKRCLAYGVKIYPYQLNTVLQQYTFNRIPDKCLDVISKEDLEKYVDGLYLCAQEMARDWTKGYSLLKELGFEEITREEGHRSFVSLEYVK